jgi:hypothetical protein
MCRWRRMEGYMYCQYRWNSTPGSTETRLPWRLSMCRTMLTTASRTAQRPPMTPYPVCLTLLTQWQSTLLLSLVPCVTLLLSLVPCDTVCLPCSG